jgi:WD40 repeat protein
LDAVTDLPNAIKDTLLASRYLIVIASKDSARSSWVEREVQFWIEHKGTSNILLVLADGVLTWNDTGVGFLANEETPLPPSLPNAFATEPRFIDLASYRTEHEPTIKDPRFRSEIATLAATIHGCSKDSLIGEDLRLYKQARRHMWTAIITLVVLLIVASIAAYKAASNLGQSLFAQGNALFRMGRYEDSRQTYERARLWIDWTWHSTLAIDAALAFQTHNAVPPILTVEKMVVPNDAVAAVTPNGKWVLIAGKDGLIRQAHRDRGYEFRHLGRHEDWITAIAVSVDSREAVSVGRDGILKVWDLEEGQEKLAIKVSKLPLWAVALSPDGQTALSGGDDNKIRVWDVKSGMLKATLAEGDHPHKDWINGLGFSGHGDILFSSSRDGAIKIWNAENWSFVSSFGPTASMTSAAITEDGTRIVSTDEDGLIRVWDVFTGQEVKRIDPRASDRPQIVLLIPEIRLGVSGGMFGGARLAYVGGAGGSLSLWDLQKGERLKEFEGHRMGVRTLSLCGTDDVLLTASDDGAVRLWPAMPIPSKLAVDALGLEAVALSPSDSRIVAAGGKEGKLVMWDADTSRELKMSSGHGAPIKAISFFADGDSLLIATRDGRVMIGSVRDDKPRQTIKLDGPLAMAQSCGQGNGFVAVRIAGSIIRYRNREAMPAVDVKQPHIDVYAVSHDCKRVAVGASMGALTVWDLEQSAEFSTIGRELNGFITAAFTADDERLLVGTGNPNRTIELWTIRQPKRLWSSSQLPFPPTAIGGSSSGTLVMVGDLGGNIHVIDLKTGEILVSYKGHDGAVQQVAVDARGSRGISAGVDGLAHVWSFAPQRAQSSDAIDDAGRLVGFDGSNDSKWKVAMSFAERNGWQLASNFFRQASLPNENLNLDVGVAYWMSGDFKRAHETFALLANQSKQNAHRVYIALALRTTEDAIKVAANREEREEEGEYWAYRIVGSHLVASPGERLEMASKGVNAFGSVIDPYLDRAREYEATGDLVGAVSDYTSALELFPSNPRISAAIYGSRARALQELNELDRALRDYDRAAELNDREPALYNNTGNIFLVRGDYDRAVTAFSRGIEIGAQNPQLWVGRAMARLRNEEVSAALGDLARGLQLARNGGDHAVLADALYVEGQARLVRGEPDVARRAFNESLHYSKSARSLIGKGVANFVAHQWTNALADFQGPCSTRSCIGFVIFAEARIDESLAHQRLDQLSNSASLPQLEIAESLKLLFDESNPSEPSESLIGNLRDQCSFFFFAGMKAATGKMIPSAKRHLTDAKRKCSRERWEYFASAAMLQKLKSGS